MTISKLRLLPLHFHWKIEYEHPHPFISTGTSERVKAVFSKQQSLEMRIESHLFSGFYHKTVEQFIKKNYMKEKCNLL